MASSGVAKWGLPTPEHTPLTGTATDVPEPAEREHEVVVVVAAMVVVVCCTPVVDGAVEAALLHAATSIPIMDIAAVRRTRRCLTSEA
jgi:hypothetical protein